ncbi:YceD family protein [Roseivivax sp. CAU 1753]
MSEAPHTPGPFRTADLPNTQPTRFRVTPDEATRAEIAATLDFTALRKVVFDGAIKPLGKRGWRLEGHLGATVVQPCIVTLAPVTTRIETDVVRSYLPEALLGDPEPGSEIEMPEDDTTEPLGSVIDPSVVLIEALSLAAPDYPRAETAAEIAAESRPPGAAPIRDEDTKPFAGLAGLMQAREKDDESGAE